MGLNKLSITSQMILSLVMTSFFIIIFITLFQVWYSINHEKQVFLHESRLEADLVVDLVTAPLAFYDLHGISTNINRLHENKNVLLAVLYTPDIKPLFALNPSQESLPTTIFPLGVRYEHPGWNPWKLGKMKNTLEIKQNNQLLGYLYIEKRTERITSFVKELLTSIIAFSFGMILILYIVSRILSKKSFNRLLR